MIKRVFTIAMVCLTASVWPWAPAMAVNLEPYKITIKSPDSLTVYSSAGSGLSFDNDQEVLGQPNGTEAEHAPAASPGPSITLTAGLTGFLLPFTFDTLAPANLANPLDKPLKVMVVTNTLCKPRKPDETPPVLVGLEQGPNVEGLRWRIYGTKNIVLPSGASFPVKLAMDFTLSKAGTACTDGKISYAFTRNWSVKQINLTTGAESQIATGKYHIHNPKAVSPIPEPGSLALLVAGALAGALALRARKA